VKEMEIKISKQTDNKLKNASKTLGFNEKEIIERAILFYLDTIKKQLELKQEFEDWNMLSDEALVNFEESL
jgi:hypothetical protein